MRENHSDPCPGVTLLHKAAWALWCARSRLGSLVTPYKAAAADAWITSRGDLAQKSDALLGRVACADWVVIRIGLTQLFDNPNEPRKARNIRNNAHRSTPFVLRASRVVRGWIKKRNQSRWADAKQRSNPVAGVRQLMADTSSSRLRSAAKNENTRQ